MKTQTKLAARIRSDTQRFESLKREIVQLNYFCKGTVLKRMMKCGHKQCACHHDPAKRHGPYLECTYKIQNKTVNLRLYPGCTSQNGRNVDAPFFSTLILRHIMP